MISARKVRLLLMNACVGAVLPHAAQAQEMVTASATASANLGYSSNPFSTSTSNSGSASVEVSLQPQIRLQRARDIFTLVGGLRYQRYFEHYSNSSSYQANFDYRGTPSEQVKTHLNLGFESAIVGAVNGIADDFVDPSLPAPPVNTGVDLSLFGTRDRRKAFNVNGDMLVTLSAHDNLSISAFFDDYRYGRSGTLGDRDGYGGSAGYDRQVSQMVRIGAQASIARFDYRGPQGATEVYSGQATLSTALSAQWTLDGKIGVSIATGNLGGSQASLSGDIKLCRTEVLGSLCLNARRAVLPTGIGGTQNTTSINASYNRRLSERATLSLQADYTKNGTSRLILVNADEAVNASAGYQQILSERIRLFTSAHYRKIFGGSVHRPADFGGQLGISVVFGDAR